MVVRRCRTFIIATIACVALLFAAAVSVSLAAWTGGSIDTTASAEGSIGQFYVEYPQYAGSDFEESNVYLYGTMNEWTANDSYKFKEVDPTGGYDRQFELVVDLTTSDEFKIFESEYGNYDSFYNKTYVGIDDDNNGWNNHKVLYSGTYKLVLRRKNTVQKDSTSTESNSNTTFDVRAGFLSGADLPSIHVTLSDTDFSIYFKSTATPAYVHIYDATAGYGNALAGAWGTAAAKQFTIDGTEITLTQSWNGTGTGGIGGIIIYNNGQWETNSLKGISPLNVRPSKGDVFIVTDLGTTTNSKKNVSIKKISSVDNETSTSTGTKILNGDVPVRDTVMRGTENADGTYTYHNYVCVSRTDSVENTIAFVVFTIEALNDTDLENVDVVSTTLSRVATDENGKVGSGSADFVPRLYVDGGEDGNTRTTISKLADFNHTVKTPTPTAEQSNWHYVEEYYTKGAYCLLFFATGSDQYFALDLKIVTKQAADFKLVATASNVNHWQRFEQGYGEPYGFYLGGTINQVDSWDPRRTTKFTENHTFDPSDPSNLQPQTFNDGNGKGDYEVEYPTSDIDISLTINLTKGSEVKAYMLDNNGYRWDGKTGDMPTEGRVAYMIPASISVSEDLTGKIKFTSDANFNIIIPENGDYTFHFTGKVSVGQGKYMNVNGNVSSTGGTGYYGIPNANFLIENLHIIGPGSQSDFTITFDSNGGSSVASQTIPYNGKVIKPDDPTNGNYTFYGWYTDAACTQAYDFDRAVTGNVTLYAKWAYEITFNPEGGTFEGGGTEAVKLLTDASGRLQTMPAVSKTGYDFSGWFTAQEGGNEVDSNCTFTDSGNVWARWEEIAYSVTFNTNGGSEVTPQTISYNGKVSEPADPTKTDCTFGGWYTDEACEHAYDFDSVVNGDMILYAKWVFEITFNPEGGTFEGGGTGTVKLLTDASGRLTIPTVTKTGYAFRGWYTAQEGGDRIDDPAAPQPYEFDKNGNVWARWEEITYSVTFNTNGGSEVTPQTISYNGKVSEPADPTKTDCTFGGWYSDEACEHAYDFDSVVNGDMILYAKWISDTLEVTFDANGGYFDNDTSITSKTISAVNQMIAELPIPVRELYTFSGWYSDDMLITTSTVFTSNATVQAHWNIMSDGLYVNGMTKKSSWAQNGASEVMAIGVQLNENDKIDVIYGGQIISYVKNTASTTRMTFSSGKYIANSTFAFDFYYKTDGTKVLYVGSNYVKITASDNQYVYLTISDRDSIYTTSNDRRIEDIYIRYGSSTVSESNRGAQLTANGASVSINGALSTLCLQISGKGTTNTYGVLYTQKLTSLNFTSGSIYKGVIKWNDNFWDGGCAFTAL